MRRPELEPCTYVELGENNNCQKILEAPDLPLLKRRPGESAGPFRSHLCKLSRLSFSISKTHHDNFSVLFVSYVFF